MNEEKINPDSPEWKKVEARIYKRIELISGHLQNPENNRDYDQFLKGRIAELTQMLGWSKPLPEESKDANPRGKYQSRKR